MSTMKPRPIAATVLLLALAGCSSAPAAVSSFSVPPMPSFSVSAKPTMTPTPKPSATPDPVVQAITDRYGDCLVKLGFEKPFKIDVFKAIHKATVSGKPGVVTFTTATGNTGNLLTAPDGSDNSARALASVGC